MVRTTNISEKDKRFMKLAKQVQDTIKTPKEWREFKTYTDFYFKKLPSFQDKK